MRGQAVTVRQVAINDPRQTQQRQRLIMPIGILQSRR